MSTPTSATEQDLISGLIATYRELNANVRTAADGGPVRETMRRMRDDELRFSQALKERITGVPMPDIFGTDALPTLGTETENDTTAALIAQFGTARESTLAMLRSLPIADWDATDGGPSIRERVTGLLANDGRQLERIAGNLR